MKSWILLWLTGFILTICAQENVISRKNYQTQRLNGSSIRIDGKFDDPAWQSVEWGGGDFRVRQPNEGEEPTHQTRFKILYDDDHLYIAVHALDDTPDEITRRMSRRDRFEGDWVEVNIDSYFDKQTAFSFTINAAGVKGDEFVSNNGDNWDSSWDPIWFVDTRIDDSGWCAEFKIPLSQLRFDSKPEQVWGIQFNRRIFRKSERSNWIFIPQNSNGWVHHFGELRGINGIKPRRQIEILPYTLGRQERLGKEQGNPFATGSENNFSLGLDGKIGITSDITMNFTVNPDFGQVEADPSEVNLTVFETFFSERRPFFVAGRNILDFRITNAAWGGNYSRDNLFYSRRIGRRPHYFPDTGDNEFVDQPVNTSIVGAAKVSGKTRNGWSIGLMESFTAEEKATIDFNGDRREEVVEPATNYLVGRVQKDFNEGNRKFGAMVTAVNRDIGSDNLKFLHKSAYSGGIDLEQNFDDRKYFISGNVILSDVRGDAEALLETQTAPARFFQRPDADHLTLDSSRTSLSGHGGTIKFGKRGNFKYQTGFTWRSPGIELNDVGFLRRADEMNNWTWVGYRISKPFGLFNTIGLNANNLNVWDFGGSQLKNLLNTNSYYEFKNFWSYGFSLTRTFEEISNTELRGGPQMKSPGNTSFNWWVNSDHRKRLQVETGTWHQWGDENSMRAWEVWAWLSVRPMEQWSITINPFYNVRRDDMQYVDSVDDRYIFGTINQKTSGFTLRMNYSVTPDLSIELYGSPFISAGEYDQFKRITNSTADQYLDRFEEYAVADVSYNEGDDIYEFDEDGDAQADFEIDDPDFNFRDFNSNLVIRWEYSAGSTLFLVWSQNRNSFVSRGNFRFRNDLDNLFNERPDNVFLIKFNRWFSL